MSAMFLTNYFPSDLSLGCGFIWRDCNCPNRIRRGGTFQDQKLCPSLCAALRSDAIALYLWLTAQIEYQDQSRLRCRGWSGISREQSINHTGVGTVNWKQLFSQSISPAYSWQKAGIPLKLVESICLFNATNWPEKAIVKPISTVLSLMLSGKIWWMNFLTFLTISFDSPYEVTAMRC